MIVKIRTKEFNGSGGWFTPERQTYFQVVGESLQYIDESELPEEYVLESVYLDDFMEVYYIIGY